MPRAMKATMTAATNATGTPTTACRIDGRRSHQSTQTAAAVPTNAPPATSSSNTGGLVPSHRPPNAPQLPSVTSPSMNPAQVTPTITPITERNTMNAPFASTAPGVGSASLTTNTVSPAARHERSTRPQARPRLRIISLKRLQVQLEIAGTDATSTARLSAHCGRPTCRSHSAKSHLGNETQDVRERHLGSVKPARNARSGRETPGPAERRSPLPDSAWAATRWAYVDTH